MDEMQWSIAKLNNSVMTSELAERVIAEAKADAASVTPQSIGVNRTVPPSVSFG